MLINRSPLLTEESANPQRDPQAGWSQASTSPIASHLGLPFNLISPPYTMQ